MQIHVASCRDSVNKSTQFMARSITKYAIMHRSIAKLSCWPYQIVLLWPHEKDFVQVTPLLIDHQCGISACLSMCLVVIQSNMKPIDEKLINIGITGIPLVTMGCCHTRTHQYCAVLHISRFQHCHVITHHIPTLPNIDLNSSNYFS